MGRMGMDLSVTGDEKMRTRTIEQRKGIMLIGYKTWTWDDNERLRKCEKSNVDGKVTWRAEWDENGVPVLKGKG